MLQCLLLTHRTRAARPIGFGRVSPLLFRGGGLAVVTVSFPRDSCKGDSFLLGWGKNDVFSGAVEHGTVDSIRLCRRRRSTLWS